MLLSAAPVHTILKAPVVACYTVTVDYSCFYRLVLPKDAGLQFLLVVAGTDQPPCEYVGSIVRLQDVVRVSSCLYRPVLL